MAIFWGPFPRILEFLAALLAVAFVLVTPLSLRYSHGALRILYAVSAAYVGLLTLQVCAALACYAVALAANVFHWSLNDRLLVEALGGLTVLAWIYGLVNAARLRVTTLSIHLPNLPAAWVGRSVALVSDLHLGRILGAGFSRRVVSLLRRLQPDAVLISGDLFDGPTRNPSGLIAPWAEYSAPLGVYFVTGNHDEFHDRTPFLAAVRQTGIRVLDNERVTVDGLQIVGIHDSEAGNVPALLSILERSALDRNRASLLLVHQPRHLAVAEKAGISLQLSGHTHYGQFWPWKWLAARAHGRFVYGLNRLGNLQVITSSGVGTWGPPLRLGTRSEVVLIRFR